MKNIHRIYIAVCVLLGFVSCEKGRVSDSPVLKVSVDPVYEQKGDTLIFNVDDTIRFKMNGTNPDLINFYSGEIYHDYAFLEKDQILDAKATLTFDFCRFNGTNGRSGRISYSTDFNGQYDLESIRAATWIDIADRFNMPDGVPSQNNNSATLWYKSNNIDVSDLFESGEKVYFSFYMFDAAPNIWRTTIRVNEFTLKKEVVDDSELSQVVYAACSNADACSFKLVVGDGWAADQYTGQLAATGFYWNSKSSRPPAYRDGYAVTPPLTIDDKVNIGYAKAVPIKGVADADIMEYTYVYRKEGIYKPVFILKNSTIYDSKVTQQNFVIKIVKE